MTLKSQDSGRAAAADTTPPPPHKSERRNVSFMALCYLAWLAPSDIIIMIPGDRHKIHLNAAGSPQSSSVCCPRAIHDPAQPAQPR